MTGRVSASPPGVTLVEVVAALFVLAIAAGVASLAFDGAAVGPAEDDTAARVAAARARAIRSRAPVSLSWPTESGTVAVTAFPDGTVVADSAIPVQRLTGRMPVED